MRLTLAQNKDVSQADNKISMFVFKQKEARVNCCFQTARTANFCIHTSSEMGIWKTATRRTVPSFSIGFQLTSFVSPSLHA